MVTEQRGSKSSRHFFFFLQVNEKIPFTNEKLLTVIRESLKYFDKEYCFELVNSVPERIKGIIKFRGRVTNIFYQ